MRSRGLGSIYQTKRGTWRAEIVVGGERISKTYPTKALAAEWLKSATAYKVKVDAGGTPEATRPDVTFSDACPELLAYYASGAGRVHTEATLKGYERLVAALELYWGDRRVLATRAGDVHRWIADMREAGLSTSTIRHHLDRLSQLFKVCVDNGWITAPPCKVGRPRLVVRDRREVASEAEVAALLAAAAKMDDLRAVAMVLLAADAGLRRAEIARLDGGDVDLDGRTIRIAVRSEADRTKSGRGRDVPILSERLHAALAALDPRRGRPLLLNMTTPDGLSNLASRVWSAAGIGHEGQLHSLRHRFVTKALNGGVPAVKVQAWVGHSDLKTTLGYYHGDDGVPEIARTVFAAPHPGPTPDAEVGGNVVAFGRG